MVEPGETKIFFEASADDLAGFSRSIKLHLALGADRFVVDLNRGAARSLLRALERSHLVQPLHVTLAPPPIPTIDLALAMVVAATAVDALRMVLRFWGLA